MSANDQEKREKEALEDLSRHLHTISMAQWAGLFELLPVLRDYTNLEEQLANGQEPSKQKQWSKRSLERAIENQFYSLGLVPSLPMSYATEVISLWKKKVPYDKFTFVELIKAITLIVRANHHDTGSITFRFENGEMFQIIKALQKHVAMMMRRG